jgi:saccharopine dehydrogenase-like NADP-dependent oxidoreductase
MKEILVLGAGFVAGPLVRYWLARPEVEVVVADLELRKAQELVGSHSRGRAVRLDLEDEAALRQAVRAADVTVSLVPYAFHPLVARLCLAEKKDMVTTSYLSDALKGLDGEARRAGIMILNEVGLDPGIDHMEAMRLIHEIHDRSGRVEGFRSYCGGLPAPEANTNPFGYKFSWSPRGVLLAGRNDARYLRNGETVFVPAGELFVRPERVPIEGFGDFEGYPNRDSIPYVDLYGIPETRMMFRGTLRHPGWCETLVKIGELGLLGVGEADLEGLTYRRFVARLAGILPEGDFRAALGTRLGISAGSAILDRLEWLGLFAEAALPARRGAPLDVLERLMMEKLAYAPGERDMIVLRHEFRAAYPDGSRERIVSTLVDFGLPEGPSAMSRMVGLPAAAAVRLILEGRISRKGVLIPVFPEIYRPILEELKGFGIVFKEDRQSLDPSDRED